MAIDDTELRWRKAYWRHVTACLITFHNFDSLAAARAVKRLVQRFPVESQEPEIELIYHYEPFGVACDLAGRRLNLKNYVYQYRKIIAEPGLRRVRKRKQNIAFSSLVAAKKSTSASRRQKTKAKSSRKAQGSVKTVHSKKAKPFKKKRTLVKAAARKRKKGKRK